MGRLVKRSKEQREADLNTLADLYVKQVPQMEIARKIGISQGQVSNDLKRLLRRWEETRIHEIDRYKHEELRRINLIEAEMWECWEKSKLTPKTVVSKTKSFATNKGTPEDKEYFRAGTQEEMPVGGDMQYINGVMWCVQHRMKILGLASPTKIAQTDPTGQYEASSSAKDELLSMLGGIIKRMKPETPAEKDWVEGEIVDQLTDEKDNSVTDDDLPELAKRINAERMKRLPAPKGRVQYDQEGAILTDAVVIETEPEDEDLVTIKGLQEKLGVN